MPRAIQPLWSRRRCLQLLAGASFLPLSHAAPPPAASVLPWRVLLLSNARYQHSTVLHNPLNDARLLQQAFAARGARVTAHSDLTGAQMLQVTEQFLAQGSQQPECLWIAYSGHAVQIDGRNYLQGIDSRFDTAAKIRAQGCNLDQLLGLLERRAPQAAVFSLDACRNNPFEPLRTRDATQGLAIQDPQGICISFSTAPYTKAFDGEPGQYSPYAQALAQALSGQARKSLDQVMRETADRVYALTEQQQTPEYRSALRSEWWFQVPHVQLQPSSKTEGQGGMSDTVAPQATNRRMREISYRPDTPDIDAPTSQALPRWDELRYALLSKYFALPTDSRQRLRQGPWSDLSTEQLLMVSSVAQRLNYTPPLTAQHICSLLQPLAQDGHVLAQHLLGDAFFHDGIYEQAYKWLSLAARAGYAPHIPADLEPILRLTQPSYSQASGIEPSRIRRTDPLKAAMMGW